MEPTKVHYNSYEIDIKEEPNEDTTATVSKDDNMVFESTNRTPLESIFQAVEYIQEVQKTK